MSPRTISTNLTDSTPVQIRSFLNTLGVGVKLKHCFVVRKPCRMGITRIQGRIFGEAKSPIARPLLPVATIQPIAPVVRITTQILPGQYG